jgi:hypothetical protein
MVNVERFGARGNGRTDDSRSIQDGVDFLAAHGGGTLDFGPKVYAHASRININVPGIKLRGIGGPQYIDGALSGPRTEWKWIGADSGIQCLFAYPNANETGDVLWGCGVDGIFFNGNDCLAGNGLELRGVSRSAFSNITTRNHRTTSVYLHCTQNGTSSQHNELRNFYIENSHRDSGVGLVYDGELVGNASFNLAENFIITYRSHGVVLKSCDNNQFRMFRMFRYPGGTGYGVIFSGNNDADFGRGFSAGDNNFVGLSPGAGGVLAQGVASGLKLPTLSNRIDPYDGGNASVNVTIDPDAVLIYKTTRGTVPNFAATKGLTDQTGVVAGVVTPVSFGATTVNEGGYYASGRFRPPAGNFTMDALVTFNGGIAAGEQFTVMIYRDGTEIFARNMVTAHGAGKVSVPVTLTETTNGGGHYYDVRVLASGGANKTIYGDTSSTYFRAAMLW